MLTRAKVWYGDGNVRLESDGVCGLEIYYTGNPIISTGLQHKKGSRKILIWNNYDNVLTNEALFAYIGTVSYTHLTLPTKRIV